MPAGDPGPNLEIVLAPIILSVVASIAGHPTQVACDADTNPGPNPPPPGFVVAAWTPNGGNVIHTTPSVCSGSFAPVGDVEFAKSVAVFVHEATHARGVAKEACAEWNADYDIYSVLRDFYGFATLDAWAYNLLAGTVQAQILQRTRTLPPDYQPELCPGGPG